MQPSTRRIENPSSPPEKATSKQESHKAITRTLFSIGDLSLHLSLSYQDPEFEIVMFAAPLLFHVRKHWMKCRYPWRCGVVVDPSRDGALAKWCHSRIELLNSTNSWRRNAEAWRRGDNPDDHVVC